MLEWTDLDTEIKSANLKDVREISFKFDFILICISGSLAPPDLYNILSSVP